MNAPCRCACESDSGSMTRSTEDRTMSNIKGFRIWIVAAALGLLMLTLVPFAASAAYPMDSAAGDIAATPWSQVPHHHGSPNRRWIHRYAHPVPAPEVRLSIRPKQYGPPSIWARSWIRRDIRARPG